MKKVFSVLLVLAMVLSIGAFSATAEPETVSLTLYRGYFSNSPQGTACEQEWQRLEEEHLGVKLDITWEELPFSEFNSKMSVYMAAGDWADAFMVSDFSISEVWEFGVQGLLYDISSQLTDDSNYMSYVNASLKNKAMAYASDGKMYGFLDAAVSEADSGVQSCWAVRFDTFEELGLTVPTTLEEIYESAKALKEVYPDSYPVLFRWIDQWLNLYQAGNGIVYDGEKYNYNPYRKADAQYEVIEYLHKLYEEGLLDPEWLTDTDDQQITKCLTGSAFISSQMWGSWYAERLNYNEEYPVKWGMIDYPKTLEGETGYRSSEHEIGKFLNTSYACVINAESEHCELLCELIDYQYGDEIVNLTNWGIEGETYYVADDGTKHYTDTIMTASNAAAKLAEYGVNQSMSCRSGLLWIPQLNDAGAELQDKTPYYFNGEFGEMTHWNFYTMTRSYNDNVLPLTPASTAFDDLDLEDISVNKTALDTYVSEEQVKFITGERDLATWADYIAEMPNYGDIEMIENIYNSHIITE